ncbi:MAG: hypothetical protein II969_12740 [Anaerolineaceae bacterium]|nr:hypothetical protein [Anaerolineaceae bacterium]
MCITEYDEVKTMNMFREEGREEGQLQALISQAEKRYITIEQATEEAGMTVEEFLEKMKFA